MCPRRCHRRVGDLNRVSRDGLVLALGQLDDARGRPDHVIDRVVG